MIQKQAQVRVVDRPGAADVGLGESRVERLYAKIEVSFDCIPHRRVQGDREFLRDGRTPGRKEDRDEEHRQ